MSAVLRRKNLLALFGEFVAEIQGRDESGSIVGLDKAFALRLEVHNTYLSGMKNGGRTIGDRMARQVEAKCKKTAGWLDQEHGGNDTDAAPKGLAQFIARAEAAYRAADNAGRKALLASVAPAKQ